MKLTVTSETSISFEVRIEHEGEASEAIVRLDGGQWVIMRTPQGGTVPLAAGRVWWPEVLKRAFVALAADVGAPVKEPDPFRKAGDR